MPLQWLGSSTAVFLVSGKTYKEYAGPPRYNEVSGPIHKQESRTKDHLEKGLHVKRDVLSPILVSRPRQIKNERLRTLEASPSRLIQISSLCFRLPVQSGNLQLSASPLALLPEYSSGTAPAASPVPGIPFPGLPSPCLLLCMYIILRFTMHKPNISPSCATHSNEHYELPSPPTLADRHRGDLS
jgi:hypothetical protein